MRRDTAALALVVIVYAACVLVVSSVLRGKGVLLAAAAAVAVGFAIRSARRGRRAFLNHLVFVTVLAAAGVGLTEAVLRGAPGLLSGAMANAAFGGYHGERDGIYELDPYVGTILRPGFSRRMYWNGHTWHHETNELGFRGPHVDRADAVFLGDSMIYGHGVEDEDTVPARFARETGLSRANLGVQGSSPVQALELLRRIGQRLHPRLVFLCVHPNDVSDPLSLYDVTELERFVRQDGYRPRVRRPAADGALFEAWLRHATLPLVTGRVVRALVHRLAHGNETVVEPDDAIPEPVFVESDLGWAVLRKAVREIDQESRKLGARLIVFDLGFPPRFTGAVERLAQGFDIAYSGAGREALERARTGEDVFLRHDGHWSKTGSAIVARALARLSGSSAPRSAGPAPAR